MSEMKITTNHVPRDIIDAWELTEAEQAEFDYLDWPAIKDGSDSAQFFRYRGTLYDLGEFTTTSNLPKCSALYKWDGYMAESFFSAIVVKYANEYEQVVVGLALS